MVEFTYSTGPRVLENGVNLDADIIASHPEIQRRKADDPVADGSLGENGYLPGQRNRDGSLL